MFHFMNFVRPFAIFRELCDRMRFEVDCTKSHHRVISEGLKVAACILDEDKLKKKTVFTMKTARISGFSN